MKRLTESRGSILIWTLLLGISLATVFFFFSQRLNANVASQRATIKYQNARMLLYSYADYIQGLPQENLKTIRNAGDISFEGISGTLTNEVDEIAGIIDAGDSISFSADLPDSSDKIKIEWDLCSKDNTEILEIDDAPATPATGGCSSLSYEKAMETTNSPFKLGAPSGPTNFKLTALNGAVLYDKKWTLNLEYSLGFRKKLTTSLTFIPH